jgi:hypothetical protein
LADDDGIFRYGFIADEVAQVFPDYVAEVTGVIDGEDVTDLKTLSLVRMIPLIVKSIQELSAKVEALENA